MTGSVFVRIAKGLAVAAAVASFVGCAGSVPKSAGVAGQAPTATSAPDFSGARLSPLPDGFAVEDRAEYVDLSDGLRNGQFDFLDRRGEDADLPEDIVRLVAGLGMLYDGRTGDALEHFRSLASEAEDANVVSLAGNMVAQLLYDRRAYRELAEVVGEPDDPGSTLVHVLADLPELTVEPVEPPATDTPTGSRLDELRRSTRGHPYVHVRTNGRDDFWIFDTGASQSVIAASVAKELGIEPVSTESIAVSTSTTLTPPAKVGLLDEMRLGDVVARNVPVLIYDDADLTFDDREIDERIVLRGVVGWPVIRELYAELDFARETYTARLADAHDHGTRNFSWIGYPFVRVASLDGQPLLFGLDTGSWNTSLRDNAFRKLTFGEIRDETAEIGGVGGSETFDVRVVDRLDLAIGGLHVALDDARSESGSYDVVFFDEDGVIGSDVALRGTMVLDYPNGYFGVVAGR